MSTNEIIAFALLGLVSVVLCVWMARRRPPKPPTYMSTLDAQVAVTIERRLVLTAEACELRMRAEVCDLQALHYGNETTRLLSLQKAV